MQLTPIAAQYRCWRGIVLAAALLAGCLHTPPPGFEVGEPPSSAVRLPEPGANEIAIVININSPAGNHAGMFVGARLSDPAGSYRAVRVSQPDWKGPALEDYIHFQKNDGDRIQIYRFTLAKPDFDMIEARVAASGWGAPLFCAADVQNQIAGVGPFTTIKPVQWTSPATLGEELRALVDSPSAPGVCIWPDGQPCQNR